MNTQLDLLKTTEYIFSPDWDTDFTDKELDDLDEMVDNLISEHG